MDCAALIVLANALILGIRHGIDWDHIAAIADIVGTASATRVADRTLSISRADPAIRLSWCYALGHATIVLILGIAALCFSSVLPSWIDPLMEKAVGLTLLFLSGWIFYSLLRKTPMGDEFVLQSRWMFLAETVKRKYYQLIGTSAPPTVAPRRYNATGAFGIGVIHGFGAETGTQVLLIAAVGGASNHILGVTILLSFISGLLISNTLVAFLTTASFFSSAKFKPAFAATSVLTGIFSLVVGMIFLSGNVAILPNLQK